MIYKRVFKLFLGLIVLLSASVSCVDERYDLNEDISLDMNAGGSAFSIPIGSIDSVKLSELIDESGMLTVDETGRYALTKSDVLDPVDIEIDPVVLDVQEVTLDPVSVNFSTEIFERLGLPPGLIVVLPDTISAKVEQVGNIVIDTEVPDELVAIRTIELDKTVSATYQVTFQFEGFPQGVGNLIFDEFRISLPDFLRFAEEDQVVEGVLMLDGEKDEFSPYEGFSRDLTITGVDFSKMNNGEGLRMQQIDGKNRLILDAPIAISGTLKIGEARIDISELNDIQLVPVVTVAPLHVAKFTGLLDPEVDTVRQSLALDLDEDLDFLKEEDVVLEVHNPQISLSIRNSIGMPVNLNIEMYAKDERGQVIESSKIERTTLKVNAAAVDGQATQTNFLVSRQGTQREGYETVQIETLSNLLKVLPDSIILEMTAHADLEQTHHIDLTKAMQISGSYEIMVPMHFDTLHVNYRDTIDGLIDDLSDVSDKLKNVDMQVLMTAENSIPVSLKLEVVPLNAARQEMTGITASVSGLIAAGNDTGVSKTPVIVALTSKDADLSRLDALALRITAVNGSRTGSDLPLNANQFIRFTGMTIKVTGGINLDLNE